MVQSLSHKVQLSRLVLILTHELFEANLVQNDWYIT